MTDSQKIHTFARRLCIERIVYWRGLNSPQPEVWIRYHVLDAILWEVESLNFDALPDFETTQELILLAISTSQNVFTRNIRSEIELEAINEERGNVALQIENWNLDCFVTPLFYRRSLTNQESDCYRAKLAKTFDITSNFYWSPIDGKVRPEVLVFMAESFAQAIPPQMLRALLASHGIDRVLEIQEGGHDCWLDLSEFEAFYEGEEGFWSSQTLDWLIYASHENSISIGGWLSDEIKVIWPEWEAGLWKIGP